MNKTVKNVKTLTTSCEHKTYFVIYIIKYTM